MKRFLFTALLGLLLIINVSYAEADGSVAIKFGDVQLQTNRQVLITNGRTLIPLRDIFEALGASVSWDAKTRTVTAKRGTEEIRLTVGDPNAKRGQKSIKLDVAPAIYNNFTYVPLRFVAESLGAKVAWDAKTRTVTITDTVTAKWLEKAKPAGKPLFWKIADVNKDGQPEFLVLIETKSGRQLLVFTGEKQVFAGEVLAKVNEISIIDLDANTKGISVYHFTSGSLSNVTIFKITTEVKELGEFGAGTGNIQFVSDTGKTVQITNPGSGGTGNSSGSDVAGPPGPGTPPAQPAEVVNINGISQSFFDVILSGDLEKAKALSANPNDPNTAAYIQKSSNDATNFINQHNGAAWEPANGAVISGDKAEYYSWVKYPEAHGYLVISLEKINNQWVITNAEFKIIPQTK